MENKFLKVEIDLVERELRDSLEKSCVKDEKNLESAYLIALGDSEAMDELHALENGNEILALANYLKNLFDKGFPLNRVSEVIAEARFGGEKELKEYRWKKREEKEIFGVDANFSKRKRSALGHRRK